MSANKQSWYAMTTPDDGVAEIELRDEIGGWGVTAAQFSRDLKALGKLSEIHLTIQSPGGSILEGHALFNILRAHPAAVHAHIDFAASMATVVAMAADHRTIAENGWFMVHNPWTVAMGESEELRKQADLLDKMKEQIVTAYEDATGLDRAEIVAMMDDETWMTGAEAVAAGFADDVSPAIKAAASIAPWKLTDIPAAAAEWLDLTGMDVEPIAPAEPMDPETETEGDPDNGSDPADPPYELADLGGDGPVDALAVQIREAANAAYEEGLAAGATEARAEAVKEAAATVNALQNKVAELTTALAAADKCLADEREAHKAALDKAKAEAKAEADALKARIAAIVPGFRTPDSPPAADAPHPFTTAVARLKVDEGLNHNDALAAVAARFPELHADFIRVANQNKHADITSA